MNWLEKRILSKRKKIDTLKRQKQKLSDELKKLNKDLEDLEKLTVNQLNIFTGKRYDS